MTARDDGPRTSADVIERIFAEHFPGVESVLDATYGRGTFWKWPWRDAGISLTGSDLYAPEPTENRPDAFVRLDFTAFPDHADWHWFDVVVFDPPFTAQGPNTRPAERHNDRYGSTRDLPGAPPNIGAVRDGFVKGIRECATIARCGLIVKAQDVVEGGDLHPNVILAANAIVRAGFNIVEWVPFNPPRRKQPPGRRVTGLGGRPSVFLVARRVAAVSLPMEGV